VTSVKIDVVRNDLVTQHSDPGPTGSPRAASKGRSWTSHSLLQRPRIRVGALVALAFVAGLIVWLVVRGGDSSTKPAQAGAAEEASVARLQSVAQELGHPIFWLGRKKGYTYELTQTRDGKVYIRYLPPGVDSGADKPYLSVATYPFPGAFGVLRNGAKARGSVSVRLAQGGVALLDRAYPKSVHAAYPGLDYQVEVFDPTPLAALRMVGHLASLGPRGAAQATSATAASVADLRSLARRLGHPIYWAGQKPGYTYELTQNSAGAVFIRYLPPGIAPGANDAYPTVATYPFPQALAAIRRVARGNKAGVIKLSGGGLAVIDRQYPKSIHLAYPHSNFQIEVFAPSPAQVRRIVVSQKIAPIT
jgi:hypothetical protein